MDDHPLVRKGISLCLAGSKDIRITGETGEAREVLPLARELLPDVVILDIDLPQISGLAVARQLQSELPAIKVLMLSIYENPETIRQSIQAGARGYFFKHSSPLELAGAVETVSRGELYFSPEVVRSAVTHFVHAETNDGRTFRLTSREREVLVQIAEGWSTREIASRLGISARTVEFHRERLKSKLNLHSAARLTRFAMAQGWVSDNIEVPVRGVIGRDASGNGNAPQPCHGVGPQKPPEHQCEQPVLV